jgi:hypothetical protein
MACGISAGAATSKSVTCCSTSTGSQVDLEDRTIYEFFGIMPFDMPCRAQTLSRMRS